MKKTKRGGRRAGSGRKPGVKNRVTRVLKELANEYTEEAIETLVQIMRDSETSPAVRVQAARELLDRSHGRPSIHIDPTSISITQIPWEELREIRNQSRERALQRHREVIEGRYERLGISREYQSD